MTRTALFFASLLLVACGGDVRVSTGTADRTGSGGSGRTGSGGSEGLPEAGAGGLVHSIPLPPPSVDCTTPEVATDCFSMSGYFDGTFLDSSCTGPKIHAGTAILCTDEALSYYFTVPSVGEGLRQSIVVSPGDAKTGKVKTQLAIAATASPNADGAFPGAWTFDTNFSRMEVDVSKETTAVGYRESGTFEASWGDARDDCFTLCRSAIVHGSFSVIIESR